MHVAVLSMYPAYKTQNGVCKATLNLVQQVMGLIMTYASVACMPSLCMIYASAIRHFLVLALHGWLNQLMLILCCLPASNSFVVEIFLVN